MSTLKEERKCSNGQELTDIESEIDNNESDDQKHQFIESVETENSVYATIARTAAAANVDRQADQDGGHLCDARRIRVV
jgi:hypothetical protein